MIDLHTHVLPGVDDGAPDLDTTLAMARVWEENGVATVVATPHVSFAYDNTAASIEAAVAAVNGDLVAAGHVLRVLAGAEVNVTLLADLADAELRTLGLGGGPNLLLEFPLGAGPAPVEGACAHVWERGMGVVVAHAERCHVFQRDPERLAGLVASGATVSITAGSLSGRFGREVRNVALAMLEAGLVHNVSSDAHGVGGRPPELLAPLAAVASELPELAQAAAYFTQEAPAAILAGEPVPLPPRLRRVRRRGLLRKRALS